MKCVKKDNKISRVSDERARKLVNKGYAYCPKSEYRAAITAGNATRSK
jgi:hypothetical protein